MPESLLEGDGKYTCCRCREILDLSKDFYKCFSDLYSDTGYMPVCKSCFTKIIDAYTMKYGSQREAMKRACMAFDIYYNDELFDQVEDDDAFIGKYLRGLNRTQYRKKTFDNSLDEGTTIAGVLYDKKARNLRDKILAAEEAEKEKESSIDPADIKKWGAGFAKEDYDEMNRHYTLLKAANPRADGNQENYIMDCCRIKMHQLKASREGRLDDFQKMTDLYTKTYKAGNLKSVGDGAVAEDFTIGVTAETIEKFTPAEYYKNKELYRDFDNIGEYARRHIFIPLKNIVLGTRDEDPEYSIHDDETAGDDYE